MTTFNKWLDTFVEEKGWDIFEHFEVRSKGGTPNLMTLAVVIEAMKIAPASEQNAIKNNIVRLDFANADVRKYFKHLAQALAID